MEAFTRHKGMVAALDRVNVDTDQIIPKEFLKRVERSGFGQFLFYHWRHDADGNPNPEFELNQPRYAGASLLLAGANFGCGSSREHAPWALADYGFKVVLAPSFADIFYNNCFKNGLLAIRLPEAEIAKLFAKAQREGFELEVDLETQVVRDDEGWELAFEIEPYRRELLLAGLDEIGVTLQPAAAIAEFEKKRTNVLV
jgi:3-isopropylmalate/(R)-2-methylmalate dehydratase small subunit